MYRRRCSVAHEKSKMDHVKIVDIVCKNAARVVNHSDSRNGSRQAPAQLTTTQYRQAKADMRTRVVVCCIF